MSHEQSTLSPSVDLLSVIRPNLSTYVTKLIANLKSE
jgi:hypothetical protein